MEVSVRTMDKRGDIENALALIRFAIMTAIVIIFFVMILNTIVRQTSDTRPTELALYDQLFIYSQSGFHDDGKPFVIDISKFDERTINGMLGGGQNQYAAGKFNLVDLSDDSVCAKHSCVQYWNKEWYDRYKPLSFKNGTGSSIAQPFNHQVIIKTEKGNHIGILSIELVTPAR
jgi:hypothetical protein